MYDKKADDFHQFSVWMRELGIPTCAAEVAVCIKVTNLRQHAAQSIYPVTGSLDQTLYRCCKIIDVTGSLDGRFDIG